MLVIWRCVGFNLQEIWNCFWEREIHGHHAYVHMQFWSQCFDLQKIAIGIFTFPEFQSARKMLYVLDHLNSIPWRTNCIFAHQVYLFCCCYFLLLHFYWHILSCALLNMKFVSALWDKWSKIPFSSCSKVF